MDFILHVLSVQPFIIHVPCLHRSMDGCYVIRPLITRDHSKITHLYKNRSLLLPMIFTYTSDLLFLRLHNFSLWLSSLSSLLCSLRNLSVANFHCYLTFLTFFFPLWELEKPQFKFYAMETHMFFFELFFFHQLTSVSVSRDNRFPFQLLIS